MRSKFVPLFLLAAACAVGPRQQLPEAPPASGPARYLYIWAGDHDLKESDFLAVVDVRQKSPTYGQVIATETVGMSGTLPHHLEYELPSRGRLLFANGHHHERIFLFDTEQAERPRLVRTLSTVPPFRYPHDFARLPNGNVLVGFLRSEGRSPAVGDTTSPGGHGGIAELDAGGRVLKSLSAADSSISVPIRPYAFAILPLVDRLLTTSAAMMEDTSADVVQAWRLSDLKLLRTLQVPVARLKNGEVLPKGHQLPFEPRLMPDGSVLFNAYGCGLYRVTKLDTADPEIRNVYTVDVPSERLGACGIPVVVSHFWIMTVGRMSMLVTLNIQNPEHPVEVSRLLADTSFRPHWLAKDPGSDRLIVGAENGGENRMLMARVDTVTGRLFWDESFRSLEGSLGISFRRDKWPHGETGEAFGHAALFRP